MRRIGALGGVSAVRDRGDRPAARGRRAGGRRPSRSCGRGSGPRRRCRGHPVRRRDRGANGRNGAVGDEPARSVRPRLGSGWARAGADPLRRMWPRRGCACGDGGRASQWRPRRGGGRDRSGGDGLDPPAPARRRGRRDDRLDAEARAKERRGSARPAIGRTDPLADRSGRFGAAAGGRGRPGPLAYRTCPPARRRAARMDHGGLR